MKIPWRRKWQHTTGILAWEILWTEEPGVLQFMGLQRVGCNWAHSTHGITVNPRQSKPKWQPLSHIIIKLLKNKIKRKYWEQPEMIHYMKGKPIQVLQTSHLNPCRSKTVEQHLWSSRKTKLSTQNFMCRKKSFMIEDKIFSDVGDLGNSF